MWRSPRNSFCVPWHFVFVEDGTEALERTMGCELKSKPLCHGFVSYLHEQSSGVFPLCTCFASTSMSLHLECAKNYSQCARTFYVRLENEASWEPEIMQTCDPKVRHVTVCMTKISEVGKAKGLTFAPKGHPRGTVSFGVCCIWSVSILLYRKLPVTRLHLSFRSHGTEGIPPLAFQRGGQECLKRRGEAKRRHETLGCAPFRAPVLTCED